MLQNATARQPTVQSDFIMLLLPTALSPYVHYTVYTVLFEVIWNTYYCKPLLHTGPVGPSLLQIRDYLHYESPLEPSPIVTNTSILVKSDDFGRNHCTRETTLWRLHNCRILFLSVQHVSLYISCGKWGNLTTDRTKFLQQGDANIFFWGTIPYCCTPVPLGRGTSCEDLSTPLLTNENNFIAKVHYCS